jgi:type VI secretion system protein ImpE
MNASDLFKAGRLQDALDAQLQEVKAQPGDVNRRLFLFELAAFTGDLERAGRQIEMLTFDTPELLAASALYRHALDAEKARRDLFAKGQPPQFFQPPPEHVAKRLEAVTVLRSSRPADAAKLLHEANEAAPALKGQFNEKDFEGARDADDLFGPVLEAFSQGRYFWVPLEQVNSVAMNPPKFPRDLLWVPARLMLKEGSTGDVLLPALYPNSHESSNEAIKLGRAVDWLQPAEGLVRGIGAKTFLIGDDAPGLLDWRELLIA